MPEIKSILGEIFCYWIFWVSRDIVDLHFGEISNLKVTMCQVQASSETVHMIRNCVGDKVSMHLIGQFPNISQKSFWLC